MLLAFALLAVVATGCYHRHPHPSGHPSDPGVRSHGPPPHAPAHGHRAKHHDRDFEFDQHRGVYIVIGLPGIFWRDGWYHRRFRDRWQRSEHWDGPWYDSRWDDVPPGLRGGGPGKGKGKGKKKGY